jgi:hypothetical protein
MTPLATILICLAAALVVMLSGLLIHRKMIPEGQADSIRAATEVLKLFGLCVVAGLSFYLIEQKKQLSEEEQFEIQVFKTFADLAASQNPEQKISVLRAINTYKSQNKESKPRLVALLDALTQSIISDQNSVAVLARTENANLVTSLASSNLGETSKIAKELETDPLLLIVKGLYASDASTRGQTYDEIIKNYRKNSKMVDALLNYGFKHTDNLDGVYNTIVSLTDMSRDVTKPRLADIQKYVGQTDSLGPRISEKGKALLSWINTR